MARVSWAQELESEQVQSKKLQRKAAVLESSNREMNDELTSAKKHVQTLTIDLGKAETSRAQLSNELSKTKHKLVTCQCLTRSFWPCARELRAMPRRCSRSAHRTHARCKT